MRKLSRKLKTLPFYALNWARTGALNNLTTIQQQHEWRCNNTQSTRKDSFLPSNTHTQITFRKIPSLKKIFFLHHFSLYSQTQFNWVEGGGNHQKLKPIMTAVQWGIFWSNFSESMATEKKLEHKNVKFSHPFFIVNYVKRKRQHYILR